MKQEIKRRQKNVTSSNKCGNILHAMKELQIAIDSINLTRPINTFVTSPKPEVAYENSRN